MRKNPIHIEPRRLRAVVYLRCSTEEQNLDSQREIIRRYIENEGWLTVGECSDEGVSGKTLNRPGLTEARRMLASDQADVLIATKLDRLSRSVTDFCLLMQESERIGYALVVCDMKLDTTTPNGKLVATMMAAFAQWYREMVATNTKEALQELKRQGKILGKPSPVTPEHIKMIRTYLYPMSGVPKPSVNWIARELGIPVQTCRDYCKRIEAQEAQLQAKRLQERIAEEQNASLPITQN